MVAAVSTGPNLKSTGQAKSSQNPIRPPLLPSETGNNVAANRRPKPREVTSRYLSSSSSSSSASSSSAISNSSGLSTRRCATPTLSRARVDRMAVTPSPAVSTIKRSQSAERRRPATPRPNGAAIGVEMSAAAKMLVSSKRCLSVSFQGESFSMPISKSKSTPTSNLRKGTPERRSTTSVATTPRKEGNQLLNARPVDQQPWPSRSRQLDSVKSLNKSVDLGSVRKSLNSQAGNSVRDIKQSLGDGINRIQRDGKLQNSNSKTRLFSSVGNSVSGISLNRSLSTSESATSETESVSSDNNNSPKGNLNIPHGRAGPRGIIVPARFMQETRLRRQPDPSSPLSRSNSLKTSISSSPRVNPISRGLSPMRSNSRPSSPSRPSTPLLLEKSSPSRGMASPSRVRNATAGTSYTSSGTSVLCFSADVRRGKVHENKISDAHFLRLLHNRQLQWRFANARAEAALSLQQTNAESNLYDVWRATSELRLSVTRKKLELARLILKLKLSSILEKQMLYLDEWASMEKDHSSSLLGITESLQASTIRLPIAGGAVADIQGLKDAICSALDVLQAMASPICSLLSKVEQMNSLLAEMASISSNECTLLEECNDFVSALAAMQVKDCSLRTHILQVKRVERSS